MRSTGNDAISQLMRGLFGLSSDEEAGHWSPPTDVYETDRGVVVALEVAGAKIDTLSVSLQQDVLTVRGEREDPVGRSRRNYHAMELRYGPFLRRVRIPCAVSAAGARASYRQGVLTVWLPMVVRAEPGPVEVSIA